MCGSKEKEFLFGTFFGVVQVLETDTRRHTLSSECPYFITNLLITEKLIFFLQVTSPYGNNLHHNENVTQGQFAFTTTESGNYVACFWMDSKNLQGTSISLDWKTGISAKDWDSVAKKEKIEVINKFHSFSLSVYVISLWHLFI
jgi:hypothetical protein